jgi:hypothetical protein
MEHAEARQKANQCKSIAHLVRGPCAQQQRTLAIWIEASAADDPPQPFS